MQSQVQSIIDEMLEPLLDQDEIEFIGQFMYHVPLIVLLEMYDLPRNHREVIRDWAGAVGRLIGADLSDSNTVRQIHQSVFELRKYLMDFFEQKRDPRPRRSWARCSMRKATTRTGSCRTT